MASPYPKPVEQKIREGNPGQRKLPEPILVSGRPQRGEMDEPAEHLSPDAKEFWRETVWRLVECGILDRVDRPLLEMLATQYGRIQACRRVIDEAGYFTRGSVGQLREHPALKIEREAVVLFHRIAMEFGMTPIGRTRLGLAELSRRHLVQEMVEALGPPTLRPVGVIDAD
ncbi:MAG: phage terminase small subunit P27 family [Solirubrobacteraceae bacterium]